MGWDNWQVPTDEIHDVAKKFVMANALNPEIAALQFDTSAKNVPKSRENAVPGNRSLEGAISGSCQPENKT